MENLAIVSSMDPSAATVNGNNGAVFLEVGNLPSSAPKPSLVGPPRAPFSFSSSFSLTFSLTFSGLSEVCEHQHPLIVFKRLPLCFLFACIVSVSEPYTQELSDEEELLELLEKVKVAIPREGSESGIER